MPPTDSPASVDPELMLKTVPPRPPYRALTRRHLDLNVAPFGGAQIVLLEAPTGWGKTALLAQWRRAALDAGGLAAWLSAGPSDEASRLVQGLALALERASGTPRRHAGAAGFLADPNEAATAWLAFAASLPYEILVLLDDVEQLPASGASLLHYVLRNLPSNVRAALAGHTGLRGLAAGLESSERFVAGPAQLRLTVEEACSLATIYGAGADEGARLHEDTDGWPLGVQLALRARSRTQGQPDHRRIVAGMLQALAPDDRAFLLDTAICEILHPDLCTALAGSAEGAARLARLVAGTPLFTEAEDGHWVRLQTLARELLCSELAAWPAERRAPLHLRASTWFEEQGMLPDAARHAHAAGADERAFGLAERGLLELVRRGQLDALAVWRDLLPEAELQRRPRLRLAVAWSLAVSDRPARAMPHVEALLASGAAEDELLRCELAMVACAAYLYADEPDRFDVVFAPWSEQAPCGAGAWLQRAHANRRAALALMHGRPAQARSFLGTAGARSDGAYSARWSELLCGYSYLWQGQARLAADALQAPVAAADAALGRRHPLSTMLATVLAAASYEGGQIETAQLLLANRLDVLERSATPDLLILGHLTAARIAAVYGMEHRALDLCDALLAAGERRRLPRVCMAALAEQIRLHALRERIETCRQLYARLLAFFDEGRAQGPLWERQALLLRDTACAHLALACGDWQDMLAALEQAASHAEALQLGGAAVEIMKLRAQALDRIDGSGARLAREAAGLTRAYGLAGAAQSSAAAPKMAPPASAPAPARGPLTATAAGALLLTPKEREILELLARKLSNKEIAHILAVTQETVKWHLKNLFAKVEAGSRRHAISRAVMLGLLE